jgi:hypothetical protein
LRPSTAHADVCPHQAVKVVAASCGIANLSEECILTVTLVNMPTSIFHTVLPSATGITTPNPYYQGYAFKQPPSALVIDGLDMYLSLLQQVLFISQEEVELLLSEDMHTRSWLADLVQKAICLLLARENPGYVLLEDILIDIRATCDLRATSDLRNRNSLPTKEEVPSPWKSANFKWDILQEQAVSQIFKAFLSLIGTTPLGLLATQLAPRMTDNRDGADPMNIVDHDLGPFRSLLLFGIAGTIGVPTDCLLSSSAITDCRRLWKTVSQKPELLRRIFDRMQGQQGTVVAPHQPVFH